jgi:hypothetical protein
MKNKDAAFRELNALKKLQPNLAEELVNLIHADKLVRASSQK